MAPEVLTNITSGLVTSITANTKNLGRPEVYSPLMRSKHRPQVPPYRGLVNLLSSYNFVMN